MSKSVEYQLAQWGIWVRTGGGVMPRISSQPLAGMSGLPSADLSDDMALAIDGAVARLMARESGRGARPGAGEVLVACYVLDMDCRRAAERLKTTRQKISEMRRIGEAWVESVIALSASNTYKSKA